MPIIIGRNRVIKDLQRQRGDRLRQAVRPKPIAKSSKQQWRSFAGDTGQPVRKGDRMTYYITGTAPTVTTFDNARLAEAWDPALPDENTAFYLKRLDECARRFAPFFTAQDFARVFAPEDLFGFSPAGIRVQTTL